MRTNVIGLVAVALISAASIAEAQTAAPRDRQERQANGRGVEGRRLEGRPGRGGLLRGITLSEAEKAKVQAIHAKYRTEARSVHQSLRPAMENVRAARAKGDTAAARAAWSKTESQREQLRALMQRETAEIRTALTPENQRVFDANAKQLQERRAARNQDGKRGRFGPSELRGRRGMRNGTTGSSVR